MQSVKKSANYYLKKANGHKGQALLLVTARLIQLSFIYPYGLQYLNKFAFYEEVIELIKSK